MPSASRRGGVGRAGALALAHDGVEALVHGGVDAQFIVPAHYRLQ